MKADPQLRTIPVLILSSSSLLQDQRMAITLGAARYIVKPQEFSQFLQLARVIEDVWRTHQY
jgi:CheY-like chemotaxis protein